MSYNSLPLTSKLFQLTFLTCALALAGCGGGDGVDSLPPVGDGSTPNTGGGNNNGGGDNNQNPSTSKVDQIYVSSDKTQLSTGQDSVSIEIRAIDKNGGIVADVPVTVSISNAALYGLSISGSSLQTTNDEGLITLQLKQNAVSIDSQLNHESLLTVSANDGSNVVQTLPIVVSGTRADNVVASKNSVTSTDNFDVSGRILNGSGGVISNTDVALYNDSKKVAATTTNNTGEFIFDVNAAMLTAIDGNYNFSLEVNGNKVSQRIPDLLKVSSANSSDVNFSSVSDIEVNKSEKIILTLPNANNGELITLLTNKGRILNSVTDTPGNSRRTFQVVNKQVVFYVKSAVPGNATITAEYGNNKSKASTINFVSTDPTKLLLQIERAVLSPGGSTSVIAKVLDKDDAPVKNAIVQFTTSKDASGGGLVSPVAYTDNNGQAIVVYNAGQNPTATNGVIIEAVVQAVRLPDGTEKDIGPFLNDSVNITVQTKSTFISFAFADKVSSGDRNVYYFRKGSISVLNNTGKPAINQQVSVNLIPNKYGKGVFKVVKDPILNKEVWVRSPYTECDNEDINNNGILDPGEDVNNNGQLDPVNVVAVLDKDGNEVSANSNQSFNLTTDAFGKIDFSVRYFKEYAEWYQAKITVNTRVDGSESQQARLIDFPVLVDDVDIGIPLRPNMISPFGTANSCTNPN